MMNSEEVIQALETILLRSQELVKQIDARLAELNEKEVA